MSAASDNPADEGAVDNEFDAAALRALPFIKDVEAHAELGSTNDRAKTLALSAVNLPLLIITDRQTAGRGRGDHQWHTSEGALTFSLLIDPTTHGLDPSKQGLLSLATGLAVIDTVRAVAGLAAGLKWPNDVLLKRENDVGKKLAGILIEAPRPNRLVIGVGVNARNRFEGAPADVAARATSLSEAVGGELSRQQLLEALLMAFATRLAQLESTESEIIRAAREVCVLTNQRITLTDGERTITGTCHGIANDGALQIETSEGLRACRAGSVTQYGTR